MDSQQQAQKNEKTAVTVRAAVFFGTPESVLDFLGL
jgi:hypothetical protein